MTRPRSLHLVRDSRGRPMAFILGPAVALRVPLKHKVGLMSRLLDALDQAYLAATQGMGEAS